LQSIVMVPATIASSCLPGASCAAPFTMPFLVTH
jgi:hypothetical protein